MKYITISQWQGDKYIAYHPELPTVISQGETRAEAESNLIEATAMAMEHLTANGLPIPEPMNICNSVIYFKAVGDF